MIGPSIRVSATAQRSKNLANERVARMTAEELAAAEPASLVAAYGVSLTDAEWLLNDYRRRVK